MGFWCSGNASDFESEGPGFNPGVHQIFCVRLILLEHCMISNFHTCHIMTLHDFKFLFYGKDPGYFKGKL